MRQCHSALRRAARPWPRSTAASAMSSNRSASPAGSTSRPWCRTRSTARSRSAGIPVVPFAQDHGFSTTLGLRIGAFAYSTDVIELDEAAFAAIAGVELWIVDCLRREPHPTHSHLAKTLSWIARVQPRRAVTDPHGSEPRLPRAQRRTAERRRAGAGRPCRRAARPIRGGHGLRERHLAMPLRLDLGNCRLCGAPAAGGDAGADQAGGQQQRAPAWSSTSLK